VQLLVGQRDPQKSAFLLLRRDLRNNEFRCFLKNEFGCKTNFKKRF